MPIKQQAKKALRQAKKRAERNALIRIAYKEAVKSVKKATITGEDTKELLRIAQKKLDKAAKRGIMKRKTAARKLSRLTRAVGKAAKKQS